MSQSNKYLIIIPAFNEEKNITETLKKVKKSIASISADIIVIDDGSVDKTAHKVLEEKIGLIKLPVNLGNGGAVQTGFRYAEKRNYEYVILFDADGQHEAGYIKELINYAQINRCDMVIGSRYLQKKTWKCATFRELGARVFSWIASKIIKTKITDCTSGFRIISRKAYSYFAQGKNYPQKYPDADFIIMMGKLGFSIKEYHVVMKKREKGKSMHRGVIKPIAYILQMSASVLYAALRK